MFPFSGGSALLRYYTSRGSYCDAPEAKLDVVDCVLRWLLNVSF